MRTAHAVRSGFLAYRRRFDSVTGRAEARFEARDWHGMARDATERLDVYEETVAAAVATVGRLLGDRHRDRRIWGPARREYRKLVADRRDLEIAETYFNSVTRRVFHTRGVDPEVEFVDPDPVPVAPERVVRSIHLPVSSRGLVDELMRHGRFQASWRDRRGDLEAAARAVDAALSRRGLACPPQRVDVVDRVFYRGQGAYLVARMRSGGASVPLVLAVHHLRGGLVLGAVLGDVEDVSILFSYTRAAFHVDTREPAALVRFLHDLLPHRPVAELYTAIGHPKHGKTERYRDLVRHVTTTDDRFVPAPGTPGLVMIVFTLPGYDVVFKVIRDRFPPQKHVTPAEVRAKYRIVSRHDRAGRLVDAQEFEHLRFPVDRFAPALLEQLLAEAARNVEVDGRDVVLHHVYLERRVTPLDLYLRSAPPDAAAAAIVDYGSAIKNLAATNIFPGDMLVKNFGVTGRGRVVFYDYDELRLLGECRFRRLPEPEDPAQELAAEPWFGVADGDVFPEELRRFLGVGGELRRVFEAHHGDLYDVTFWRHVQARILAGETIEIYPYRRSLALHPATRPEGAARW